MDNLEEALLEIERLKKENEELAKKLWDKNYQKVRGEFKALSLVEQQLVYFSVILDHLDYQEERDALINERKIMTDFDLTKFQVLSVFDIKELMDKDEFESINKGLIFTLDGHYDNPSTMLTIKGKQFFCSECGGTLFKDSFNYQIGSPVKKCTNCQTEYEFD